MRFWLLFGGLWLFSAPDASFAHSGGCAMDGYHTGRGTHAMLGRHRCSERGHARRGYRDENGWTKEYCRGATEYRNPDGTRVDCLRRGVAVEVEWPGKWQEALGQALRYRRMNPRHRAEVWLLCGQPRKGLCADYAPALKQDASTIYPRVRVVCKSFESGRTVACHAG